MQEDNLFHYLENFISQNNWANEYTQEQARAIFTTICLVNNIDFDTETVEYDDMLSELYNEGYIERYGLDYEDFYDYMTYFLV